MTARQIILTATAAILATPATASRPAAQNGPATVYCVQHEAETGTRIRRQECLTKKQWADRGINIDEFIKK